MKVTMLGAGAMGCLFGGHLAHSGHTVSLIDINAAHIRAVNERGLTIRKPDETLHVRLQAGMAEDFREIQDYLIVFTKGAHTEQALLPALHLIGPNTTVLTAQNGLGNAETIARHIPFQSIAIGTTSYAAVLEAPGQLVLQSGGDLRIWSADGSRRPAIARLAEAFVEAGIDCKADPDVEAAIWEKVAFNAAINTLTAITKYRVGQLGDVPAGRVLAEQVAKEVSVVALARGVRFDLTRVHRLIDLAFTHHRDHQPSMLRDIIEGRATEVENINGAVVAEAHRLGLAAHVCETLLLLVRLIEHSPQPRHQPSDRKQGGA